MSVKKDHRPDVLEGAPLHYAPSNEQGVVFLFAHLAKEYRMRVEEIRREFPDCIAYEKTAGGEKRVRIEFEFRSSAFKSHKHQVRDCDCIVCWEHDWPACPLRVIELRNKFNLGFKVWLQPADAPQQHYLDHDRMRWAAQKSAHQGDLMLMYRCAPEKCIRDIYVLTSELSVEKAEWRDGNCNVGDFRCVCRLDAPVFLEDLRNHRIISTAGFIRGRLQGNHNVIQYWPYLYEMIIKRNPQVAKALSKYAPEKIA